MSGMNISIRSIIELNPIILLDCEKIELRSNENNENHFIWNYINSEYFD